MAVQELNKDGFLRRVWNYGEGKSMWRFQGNVPAVVDFYASWCGPCKALSSVLEELSDTYKERVDFYKVNTGEELELASHFGVRSVPTLLFCPLDGAPFMVRGAMPKNELEDEIEKSFFQDNC